MEYNILDFVRWRGDLTFLQDPFHEVDAMALSTIAYIEFDGIVPADFNSFIYFSDAADRFSEHEEEIKYKEVGLMDLVDMKDLFYCMARSERYRNLKLCGYINHIDEKNEKQFSAVTFQNDKGDIYVVYRGTDDTIIGWREDFNMAFMDVVPAQKEAALYLRSVLRAKRGKVRIMGHSKGGNLAVYSAAKCGKTGQRRLTGVYCMDGPGFSEKFLLLDNYQLIDGVTHWYLPHESMIGSIMLHGKDENIVKSNAQGIMQHNPFSWLVERRFFRREQELSKDAVLFHMIIDECMERMSLEQRKQFVGIVFDALEANEIKKLGDIRLKSMISLIDSVKNIDRESKELFKEMTKFVIKIVKENR